ncbi:MAG: bifunctional ADP-dependent NAD(P)H-hydrate dehydratase/NAD(P)H-hydrate epimerase, partial [Bacteroidota bacterium]
KIIIDKKFNERKNALIVDAILGTGINRPVLGFTAEVINFLNSTLIPIISIDIPSGMLSDTKNNSTEGAIIQSELTLSFQQPKYSFLLSDNGKYCGEFIVLDIGLDREFILEAESKNLYIEKYDVASLLKKRTKYSHKGTFGHALVIGGSKGKCGAAVLAGKACLKSGAGLVTIHSSACNTIILQTSIPEAMVSEDTNPHYVSELPDMRNFNAIGFGPGLGTSEISKEILKLLFQKYNGKMVIDADGINLLSDNKTLLAFLPPLTIIT